MASSYNTVTVDTTADEIIPFNAQRSGLVIKNNGSVIVYIVFDASVTTSNGIPIVPQDSFTLMGTTIFKTAVYGITSSASADVRWFDWAI
mgnify:CR=1 FL=1